MAWIGRADFMQCESCENEIDSETAKFCPECGASLASRQSQLPSWKRFEVLSALEGQSEILRSMSELYDSEDYPTLQPFFREHGEWGIALAFAFDSGIVLLEGLTAEYEAAVEQPFAILLDALGVEDTYFLDFDTFHEKLKLKLASTFVTYEPYVHRLAPEAFSDVVFDVRR